METEILILGKGDNVITMILDNLYSNGIEGRITVLNNLKLPIVNSFQHPKFDIEVVESVDLNEFHKYVLGVAQPITKKTVVDSFNLETQKFRSIIHNSLDISATSVIGNGCLINSKVSIAAHANIGDFVVINRNASVGHHSVIEEYATINPGCNIAGNIRIGKGTLIGIGTSIIDGITIGKNSIVGAGSVVTKDIPDNVVAYGSPCKVIRANKS